MKKVQRTSEFVYGDRLQVSSELLSSLVAESESHYTGAAFQGPTALRPRRTHRRTEDSRRSRPPRGFQKGTLSRNFLRPNISICSPAAEAGNRDTQFRVGRWRRNSGRLPDGTQMVSKRYALENYSLRTKNINMLSVLSLAAEACSIQGRTYGVPGKWN
jgi:hypothetical protein